MRKKYSKYQNTLVEVYWKDACDLSVDSNVIEYTDYDKGLELLPTNTTYGLFYKEFRDLVVIQTEGSTLDNPNFTLIPKDWIVDIK